MNDDILASFAAGNWRPSDIDDLFAEVLRLQRENIGLKEFALKIAERVFLAHEILGRLAERKGKR